MDRKAGEGSDTSEMGKIGYQQNAEQSDSTLWQRIQRFKK